MTDRANVDIAVIIAAAGQSTRFGSSSGKKPFVDLAGEAVWLHSARQFAAHDAVGQIILVIDANDRETVLTRFAEPIKQVNIDVVDGDDQRHQSVRCGLSAVKETMRWVAVHDAARPCVSRDEIDAVFASARQHGAAILGTPVWSTVKRVDVYGAIVETIDRQNLLLAQTPQVCRKDWLLDAYQKLSSADSNFTPTDESQLLHWSGRSVHVVAGSRNNLKITTPDDLKTAAAFLPARCASE